MTPANQPRRRPARALGAGSCRPRGSRAAATRVRCRPRARRCQCFGPPPHAQRQWWPLIAARAFSGGGGGGREWRHLVGWQTEQLTAFASTNGAHLPSRQRHDSRPCSCHRGWGSLARERSRRLVPWPPVTPTLAVAWNVPASTGATVRGSRASAFGRCNFQHTADRGLEGLEPPRARRCVPDLAPCARVREPRGGAVRAAWCSAGRAAPEAHQRSDKWRRTSRLLGASWMCAALTG